MSQHICDSEFPFCPADAKAGEFFKLRVKDLSPTQFAVGKAEIDVRAARMCKKLKKDPGKLHDYLRVRPIPIVVRGKKFYLVDHHHLVRALYDVEHGSRGKNICVYVKVLANASTLEEVYFWKTMHEQNLVYLFDQSGGGPQQPATLPAHIKDLKFDPYRSLAWIVRTRRFPNSSGRIFSVPVSCWTTISWPANTPSTISPSRSTSTASWN
jgi:hypothetical protein